MALVELERQHDTWKAARARLHSVPAVIKPRRPAPRPFQPGSPKLYFCDYVPPRAPVVRLAEEPQIEIAPAAISHQEAPRIFLRSVNHIIRVAARHYGLSPVQLLANRRQRSIVRPRQVAMYVAYTISIASFPKIGRAFGGRDHTTIMHSTRKIAELILIDPQIAADVAAITAALERP